MTEEERARLEKARKTNRKRILIAAVVIAVAVIVTLLIYEFGSRNPIDDDPGWPLMTTDSMEDGATVYGKMHFYPEEELVTKVSLRVFDPTDDESMKLLSEGKWEKYDPEADEIKIVCKNGVTLTIAKFGKHSKIYGEEYFAEQFPNGYEYNGMIAYGTMEMRSEGPFLYGSEKTDENDEYEYSYWFEASGMTQEAGYQAIAEILESLRSYE